MTKIIWNLTEVSAKVISKSGTSVRLQVSDLVHHFLFHFVCHLLLSSFGNAFEKCLHDKLRAGNCAGGFSFLRGRDGAPTQFRIFELIKMSSQRESGIKFSTFSHDVLISKMRPVS